jgi:hypothetical protein
VLRGGCFLAFLAVGQGWSPQCFLTLMPMPGTAFGPANAASVIAMLAPTPTTATVAPGRAAAAKPAMANAAAPTILRVPKNDVLMFAITMWLRVRQN